MRFNHFLSFDALQTAVSSEPGIPRRAAESLAYSIKRFNELIRNYQYKYHTVLDSKIVTPTTTTTTGCEGC